MKRFTAFLTLLFTSLIWTVACSSDQPVPQEPTTREWYQGGTLHDKTAIDWVKADDSDRLATSADYATVMLKETILWENIGGVDDMRPYAEELKECIDGTYLPEPAVPTMANSQTANQCWALMYSHIMK